MESIQAWKNRPDIQRIRALPYGELFSKEFSRNPYVAKYDNPDVFISPASGFILFSKVVDPDKDIVNVKGCQYTVNKLLELEKDDKIKVPCLVIGIFLSVFDVHTIHTPTDCKVSFKLLEKQKRENLKMEEVESELMNDLSVNHSKMQYELYNEKMLIRCYYNYIRQHYYLCLVADYEADVIGMLCSQDKVLSQADPLAVIRFGSQCDIIVPLFDNGYKFESLVDNKITMHCETGDDRLIKIVGGDLAFKPDSSASHGFAKVIAHD